MARVMVFFLHFRNEGLGLVLGHVRAVETEDEAKALIRSVFGQATIFKPVE